jgi:hypothetical protein
MNSEDGYSSAAVVTILFFLSIVTLGVLNYLQNTGKLLSSLENHQMIMIQLDEEVLLLIKQLSADPTPDADSQFDPVWTYLENRMESGIEITLEDISSRFNLNFMRTKMLDESDFSKSMLLGNTPDRLKLFRGEKGFFSDKEAGYVDFFKTKDLEDYFTVYSYANFNITYEDSLKKLYETRVSTENSHTFLAKVQKHIAGQTIADKRMFRDIAGSSFHSLYPLINTESLMNVNFVPERVLLAVLNYPYGGKRHDESLLYYEIIKNERAGLELDNLFLEQHLILEGEYLRILQYLGTRTWFWKITATMEEESLEVILCRLPDNELFSSSNDYQIIEWKYH